MLMPRAVLICLVLVYTSGCSRARGTGDDTAIETYAEQLASARRGHSLEFRSVHLADSAGVDAVCGWERKDGRERFGRFIVEQGYVAFERHLDAPGLERAWSRFCVES